MMLASIQPDEAVAGLGIASTVDDLSIIAEPECAAAVLRRLSPPEFTSWYAALSPDCLPRIRIVLRPERVKEALDHVFDTSGIPDCQERSALIQDASHLAEVFAGIMDAPYLRLRLDVITTNACRKFHRDAVTARLVCTYRGTGTQYGVSIGGTEPAAIHTVQTGSPILLRGTLWPEAPASGLLHRSPPIEGTGEARSVLVLDPVFDLEAEV